MPLAQDQLAKIGDYGLIGDCRSAALVSKFGSIDWLCWPRFDSPSIFAAILDRERGGHWSICPRGPFQVKRAYLQDSNLLETQFTCAGGRASLTDFMPVCSEEFKGSALVPEHQIVRVLRCAEGQVSFEFEFFPRRDYGSRPVTIRRFGAFSLRLDVGKGSFWLHGTIPVDLTENGARASLKLEQGDTLQFSFTYSEDAPAVLPALGESVDKALERSLQWWRAWASRCRYQGPYQGAVRRSALALKLLTYAPSGAIVAAPTTSLPERIGDALNWDYRYCWLRDASLTTRALLGCGYLDEAESFLTWLLHATSMTQPELQVLYTVFGEIAPREREIVSLSGHGGSRPVRVGNLARRQFQLDIYGEVVAATAQCAQYGKRFDRTTQKALIKFGNYVAQNWDKPDEGIWEPRSGRMHHTHSRLMCWVTLDRLLALDEKRMLEGVPRDQFTRERDRIRQQIESRAWNESLHSYVSILDAEQMDATLLRLAWYGFEHADSKRMQGTYRRVRQQLGAGNSLLYRYRREPAEGAFGICGFWGVEHLALGGGSLEEAHQAFQQLLHYQNDLGLLAEEIDPQSGNALGNFPQAFTHVGLISAALTIAEQEKGKAHPAVHVGSEVESSSTEAKQ